jgi:hypothetical protein
MMKPRTRGRVWDRRAGHVIEKCVTTVWCEKMLALDRGRWMVVGFLAMTKRSLAEVREYRKKRGVNPPRLGACEQHCSNHEKLRTEFPAAQPQATGCVRNGLLERG